MQYLRLSHILLLVLPLLNLSVAQEPAEFYTGSEKMQCSKSDVLIRVGTGGAGQSGILGAFANGFVDYAVKKLKHPRFCIAWYVSDTFGTIEYLRENVVDFGITYMKVAENAAIRQGFVEDRRYYLFRDHFRLVGPKSNPAGLNVGDDTTKLFLDLYAAATNKTLGAPSVKFLSRFDKSATNWKESQQWIEAGQVPWALPYSSWYHQYIGFPLQALTAAIKLEEYTLTDKGTFLSLDKALTSQLTVFREANSKDAKDPLLNPATGLVSANAQHPELTLQFANWIVDPKGGQKVVKKFANKNGDILYKPAPKGANAWVESASPMSEVDWQDGLTRQPTRPTFEWITQHRTRVSVEELDEEIIEL